MAKDFNGNYTEYANKEAIKRIKRLRKTVRGWINQLNKSSNAFIYCENDDTVGKLLTITNGTGEMLIESIAQIIVNTAKNMNLNPRDLLVFIESQIILKIMHKEEEK